MKFCTLIGSVIMYVAILIANTGCSVEEGATDSSSSSGVTISGSLGTVSSSGFSAKASGNVSAMGAAYTDLELYGLAFSDPPEAQKVNVGSDGSFSLSFSTGASGAQISLIFRYKEGHPKAGTQVGVVKFQDTSNVDMNGDSSSSTSIPLTGSVSLGSIDISEDGEVVVPISQISSNIKEETVTSSEAFDFTGTWVFKAYDGTMPSGYESVCGASESECNGPQENMPVYIRRIAGKSFTPDSTCQADVDADGFDPDTETCDGTTGSSDRYAIQIWQSQTAALSCGSGGSEYRLGFNNEAAKAYARTDFTGSSTTIDFFNWESGYADGWKDTTNATATREYRNCGPIELTGDDGKKYPGYRCVDTSNYEEINLEGGCTDSSSNPVHVTNWSGISPDSSCTSADHPNFTTLGLKTETCEYTNQDHDGDSGTAAISFTCKYSQKRDANFNYNNVAVLASQNANCSSINTTTDQGKIAQLQCYSEYLWTVNVEDDENKCIRRVDMDWSQTDPTKFVIEPNGPPQAMTLYVISLFKYDTSGSGSFEDEDTYFRGIQTGTNYTNCKVRERFKMSLKKRSNSELVGEFVSESQLLDLDKDACVADAKSSESQLRIGVSKSIMLLQKQ